MPIEGTTSAPVHYCIGNPCQICFPQYVGPPNTWPTGPAILQQPQGCICPPTSEQTCKNPTCPRGPKKRNMMLTGEEIVALVNDGG